jgi:putative protease
LKKRPELLSPAGNLEKLKIAIDYGADAVYGGVSHFSLRIRSGKEFNLESFKEGIDYVHNRGKKIYVTINGFPFNSQIDLLKNHIAQMRDLKPDAFIVATPGVLKLAREIAPEMDLHLSTQANVLNYLDAQFYYDIGVKRIIVAREISLKDLEGIKHHIPELETEVFVHGSMCFAYSGRCLISSLQSGRVPNRGSCANDCRFPYTIYAENEETGTLFKLVEDEGVGTYIMNSKDLNLSRHIDEIISCGVVDSLKIEGRTKSSYYTAITTKTYREAIDDSIEDKFDSEKYWRELQTTQNRGFTDAYLVHKPFEKSDTQSQDFMMEMGTHQVSGIVLEEGYFLCKFTTLPNREMEIVSPKESELAEVKNEVGEIFKQDGVWKIKLFHILTKDGRKLESVHSGNLNPIQLPANLPINTFLRVELDEPFRKIPEECNIESRV